MMTTLTPSKSITALLLALPLNLACVYADQPIGELDDEGESQATDTQTEESGEANSAACDEALVTMLGLLEAEQDQACALLVTLDYQTSVPTGWSLNCAAGDLGLTSAEALALTSAGGQDISEPFDEPANDRSFIFHRSPEEVGGVGWVSNHVGLLFDASIVAGGVGEIHFPTQFADPTQLGSGCAPPDFAFELRGYDLTDEVVVSDYQLHEPNKLDELMGSLRDTIVLQTAHQAFGAKFYTVDVLAYPRTMGPFDPSSAELLVVIEWPLSP